MASVPISGTSGSVLYVGGGGNIDVNGQPITTNPQASIYALDAGSGAVIWRTPLGSAPDHFMWSSPAYYSGHVYIGVASFGDCPLVQGEVVKLNASTGQLEATFKMVVDGCTGGGVWSSPTIDETAQTLYVGTGTPSTCANQIYAPAVVELRLADLSLVGSWQVPVTSDTVDPDIGATATLFSAKVRGRTRSMVGLVDKNGTYYAFFRDALNQGPVWQRVLGHGGCCPVNGTGSIAPSAWDGSSLYVGTDSVTLNNRTCAGSVQALNPATGNPRWQACLEGAVLGPVTVVPGVVAATAYSNASNGPSSYVTLLNAATGAILAKYPNYVTNFYGGVSIVNGVMYVGDVYGTLYAFSP